MHPGDSSAVDCSLIWDPLNYGSCVECAISSKHNLHTQIKRCHHRPWKLLPPEYALGDALYTMPSAIGIGTLLNVQLQAEFIHLCFPADTHDMADYEAVLPLLQSTPARDSSTTSLALQAACFIAVGTMREDSAMLHHGRAIYMRAKCVSMWNMNAVLAGKGGDRTTALATAHILLFCEKYWAISLCDCQGSVVWLEGVARLMSGSRAGVLEDKSSPQVQAYLHYAVAYGIARRTPLLTLEDGFAPTGDWADVLQTMMRLSAVLKAADQVGEGRFDDHSAQACAAISALTALLSIQREMAQALERQHCVSHVHRYIVARSGCEHSWAFPNCLQFCTYASALMHVIYFAALLALRRTISEMVEVAALNSNERDRHDMLECESAENCAMAIIALCGPEYGPRGLTTVDYALWFIYRYYKEKGDESRQKWCSQIADKNKSRGFRAPNLSFSPPKKSRRKSRFVSSARYVAPV